MSESNIFEKGPFYRDKTNEKVVYGAPVRKDGSVERTKDITNKEEAKKKI